MNVEPLKHRIVRGTISIAIPTTTVTTANSRIYDINPRRARLTSLPLAKADVLVEADFHLPESHYWQLLIRNGRECGECE